MSGIITIVTNLCVPLILQEPEYQDTDVYNQNSQSRLYSDGGFLRCLMSLGTCCVVHRPNLFLSPDQILPMMWAIPVDPVSHRSLKVMAHADKDSLLNQTLVRFLNLLLSLFEHFLAKSVFTKNLLC